MKSLVQVRLLLTGRYLLFIQIQLKINSDQVQVEELQVGKHTCCQAQVQTSTCHFGKKSSFIYSVVKVCGCLSKCCFKPEKFQNRDCLQRRTPASVCWSHQSEWRYQFKCQIQYKSACWRQLVQVRIRQSSVMLTAQLNDSGGFEFLRCIPIYIYS